MRAVYGVARLLMRTLHMTTLTSEPKIHQTTGSSGRKHTVAATVADTTHFVCKEYPRVQRWSEPS